MESDIHPFDWQRLFLGEAPLGYFLEVVARIGLIFLILLLVLRMLGKRGQNNLSPMQQMLMIALGSAAGDAMLYPTVALGYAALVLIGVTAITLGLENISKRVRWARDYLETRPTVLVHKGVVDDDALFRERTTRRELHAALRVQGARDISQVEVAVLEVSGEISVILNDERPPASDSCDLLKELFDGSSRLPQRQ